MFYGGMTDRPASWRMPTPKQMAKPSAERRLDCLRMPICRRNIGALLDDPRADGTAAHSRASLGAQRLDQIPNHLLRV